MVLEKDANRACVTWEHSGAPQIYIALSLLVIKTSIDLDIAERRS